MDGPDIVFVYGTLRRGAPHPLAKRLEESAQYLGGATWRGRLYTLGPYPAAVRHAGHLAVHGDLYRMANDPALWAALDAYEGHEDGRPHADGYVRERTEVRAADGAPVQAWIYRYTGPVRRQDWIPSGDWLQWSTPQG